MIQSHVVKRGRIDTSYDGLGCYVVSAEGGRFFCQTMTSATGFMGVAGGPVYFPGQAVMIAVQPQGRTSVGIILGAYDLAQFDPAISAVPQKYLVWPQVSGYRLGRDWLGTLTATGLTEERAKMYRRGMADVVAGDWTQVSRQGAGLGVEAFRAWLTAGPMCGIWANTEEQRLRMVALELEVMTMMREEIERTRAVAMESIKKLVIYPEEALTDSDPRLLELGGALHGGWTRMLAPETLEIAAAGAAAGTAPTKRARTALFHEHLSLDGSLTVTSAANIILRRSMAIEVPEHLTTPSDYVPPKATEVDGLRPKPDGTWEIGKTNVPVADPSLPDAPTSTPEYVQSLLSSPRGFLKFPTDTTKPWDERDYIPAMAMALRATDVANFYSLYRATNAIDRLPMEWGYRPHNPDVVGAQADTAPVDRVWPKAIPTADGQGKDLTLKRRADLLPFAEDGTYVHIHRTPDQWSALPRAVTLKIDRRLGSKKFYVGTSVVALLEDGSVVIEDANRASVTLAGGCITYSAPKDLIFISGRDTTFITGRHATIRAHDHVTVSSNAGDVYIKAENDLELLAANSGAGSMILQSRATQASDDGTQGIHLKSGTVVELAAPLVGLSGMSALSGDSDKNGKVLIRADSLVSVRLDQQDSTYSFGKSFTASFVYQLPASTGISSTTYRTAEIGPDSSVLYRIQTDANARLHSEDSSLWLEGHQTGVAANAIWVGLGTIAPLMSLGTVSKIRFGFPSSEEYGTADSGDFLLPETPWQQDAKLNGVPAPAWEDANVYGVDGSLTAPYPGYTAWSLETRYQLLPTTPFNQPKIGIPQPDLETRLSDFYGPSAIPRALPVVPNQNFVRGNFARPTPAPVTPP